VWVRLLPEAPSYARSSAEERCSAKAEDAGSTPAGRTSSRAEAVRLSGICRSSRRPGCIATTATSSSAAGRSVPVIAYEAGGRGFESRHGPSGPCSSVDRAPKRRSARHDRSRFFPPRAEEGRLPLTQEQREAENLRPARRRVSARSSAHDRGVARLPRKEGRNVLPGAVRGLASHRLREPDQPRVLRRPPELRENSLHKIETLIAALERFRAGLAAEAELRARRERG
jgi:hypothetical protein